MVKSRKSRKSELGGELDLLGGGVALLGLGQALGEEDQPGPVLLQPLQVRVTLKVMRMRFLLMV